MLKSKHILALLCLISPAAMLSCEGQPPVNVHDVVAPQIIEVSPDGKLCKVNIGMFDGIRAGQRLYVVRNNQLAGYLAVKRPLDYYSECIVVASKEVTELDKAVPVDLVKLRVGDHVVTKTKYISGAGLMRERVPRMVPVPYEAYDPETEKLKVAGREVTIPRDQVEQWKKEHPLPKSGSSTLGGGSP